MDGNDLIPEIFMSLMDQADKLAELDESTMNRYYEVIGEAHTFIPELVSIIGPDAFGLLVKHYGGRSLTIPTPDQILKTVRKHEKK